MRPDEHKKKKNTQYKKKHGIGVDKGGKASKHGDQPSTNKFDGSSKNSAQTQSQTQKRGGKGDIHVATREQKESVRSNPIPTTDEKESIFQSESHKSFRRREIASNWDRYEGLDEQEEEDESSSGLRGADYSQLVGAVSSSSSQFLFQDEKEWQNESGASLEEVSDLLAVDPLQLSAALDCVPLHQRLGIEETAFQPIHIELFLNHAREKKDRYNTGNAAVMTSVDSEHEHSNCVQGSATTEVTSASGDFTAAPVSAKDPDEQDLLDEILSASDISRNSADSAQTQLYSTLSGVDSAQRKDASVSNSDPPVISQLSLEDETRKEQTSLDSGQQAPGTQMRGSGVEAANSEQNLGIFSQSNIEDELDSLLEDEGDKATKNTVGEKHKDADTGDLESWLDDILED